MKIFISYATLDLDSFRIREIADFLESQDEIERIYYFERDCGSETDIIEYMEQSIQICDKVVFLCTKNALDSGSVKRELKMAVYLDKSMVPIFKNINDVPLSIRLERGIKFDERPFGIILEELFFILTGKKSKKKKFIIALSYSGKDKDFFMIHSIAEKLGKYPDIEGVFYLSPIEVLQANVLDIIEEGLTEWDVIVVFCTKNYDWGASAKMEWIVADRNTEKRQVRVIPVFMDEKDVPSLLKSRIGVLFNNDNKFVEKLHNAIIKNQN